VSVSWWQAVIGLIGAPLFWEFLKGVVPARGAKVKEAREAKESDRNNLIEDNAIATAEARTARKEREEMRDERDRALDLAALYKRELIANKIPIPSLEGSPR
jgi:hypothetical protein